VSIIEVNDLVKVYGRGEAEVKALNGLSLKVKAGEMVAIMGASGSGKSTLLNILGCLDKPSQGQYKLKNKSILSYNSRQMAELRNQSFGMIVQDFALVERYTVYRNVLIPLSYSKKPIESRRKRIEEVLAQLGILKKKNTLALKLSGGQRQRVAIARALVNDPEIILADEPTGSLDSKMGLEVINIFKEINSLGKTIIIVTHDLNVARACQRIIQVHDGKLA
jgi:putative ABC transport system ATP-binding protein